ncbi:hypothetical protein K2173_021186 [Erythroxylum novogranatense]|uniref:Autophagy-related protein 11 n=1 Tax=Erythroxylum novogranatense TaxID=1862640 RepID=A0AAV8TMV7_9ROSI|nr:hypothetical protein K2173_021186 [Erythroxylum novogranatense]
MSSSMAEGMIHQDKLLVRIAENGNSFELDCDETTPVEAVMRYVDSVARINFNDQLILCQDMKLEPQRLLSAYKLPSSDREVFIFNKARLLNNSSPPLEQVHGLEDLDPPSPPPKCEPHPLDDDPDPSLKALPSYERQFRYHFHRGHVIYHRTQLNYEACESLLREQKVQGRALEVARDNLEQFFRFIHQSYTEFMKRYTQQHMVHKELLANLERDLKGLRSIKLHPALQSPACKYLIDFVKEENLKRAVENCSTSHKQFEKKVSEFKQMFSEVLRRINDLSTAKVLMSISNLEQSVKDHQPYINEQKSIMQSLSKDVNTVKKLVDDCLSCQFSSSLRPHDAVAALGPMYDVHDKSHLPKMEACGNAILELLKRCKNEKNEMILFVHRYMQKILYATSIVKDAKLQFPVFREAMQRQDVIFTDLKMVRAIGPAYRACLAEIIRRKFSMKLYMGMAGQLAERLATRRETEVRRREEFIKAHGSYIPRDILTSMGLHDVPSQCNVNVAPFDTNLLDIDIPDLERYAPEYLVGLPLKWDKHTSLRGSFSMSNDSSRSAEMDEIVVDNLEKDDTEELFEGSELVEIAGTSKLEVENAKLKADLASAIAHICTICPEVEFDSLDDSKAESLLKNAAEKTAEALQLKDRYGKHLQSMLEAKQKQCLSYEKRIQELEQRLSDQYSQGQKLPSSKDLSNVTHPAVKVNYKLEGSSGGEAHMPYASTSEPMDEVSCISSSFDAKLGIFTRQPTKGREGVDDNMMDSSGMLNTQLDSSMLEPHREELQVSDKDRKDKTVGQLGTSMTNSSTAESMCGPVNIPSEPAGKPKLGDNLISELQVMLSDKSNQLSETESKLKAAMEEVTMLSRELEISRKLLDESQMNCAHLENCLHEARKEAQTHLYAADRRASEYNSLRASFLKLRGLFERFRSTVLTAGGVNSFADSLSAFAQSLANSIGDKDDDASVDFQKCIKVLADRSRHHEELLEKLRKLEAGNDLLRKELEDKKELVTTLYKKHQLEKQASKEKICFNRLEVHEIAAFVLNAVGHYEAINRNCSNYYLSAESVALFTDHLPSRPTYIVGQIVHIGRQIVKLSPPSSIMSEHARKEQVDLLTSDPGNDRLTRNLGSTSNPYGLPIGCEFFIVTVAMLPDMAIRTPPPS